MSKVHKDETPSDAWIATRLRLLWFREVQARRRYGRGSLPHLEAARRVDAEELRILRG